MEPSVSAILARTDIFDNLSPAQYELLAFICEPQSPAPGRILVRENEHSDDLYVIGRGGVEVLMDPRLVAGEAQSEHLDPVLLTELSEGQVFGEIALVDQGIRSATVRVSKPNTLLLRIPRQRLMMLCETYPEMGYKLMRNLAAELAVKIRQTGLTFRQYQLLLARADFRSGPTE